MRKAFCATIVAIALGVAGSASAALSPSVFDPGNSGCPKATWSGGVLHLEKNCPTATNAAAGADITGFAGQTFTSASFTLASASQCQGGSPRFDIQDVNDKVFFLGCNNVTPTINADGSATYTFTMADLLRINPTLGTPGAIKAVDVLIDVEGTADVSRIVFNGRLQVPAHARGHGKGDKDKCKKGGWKDHGFRNQGQCVSHSNHQKHEDSGKHNGREHHDH
jgi:hypothetical protein